METLNTQSLLSNTINRTRLTVLSILLVSVWLVISLSFLIDDYRQLLFQTTRENGLYEWLTVAVGLCISIVAIVRIKHSKNEMKYILPIPLLWLFSLMGIIGSLEEISWGQHIFGFESEGVFKEHNMQKETNLHNFVSQEYVNLLMQGFVYIVFIFLPIFTYLNLKPMTNRVPKTLMSLRPSLTTIGVFTLSCCFQDYFRPETLLDTSLAWSASALYIMTLIINKANLQEWLIGVALTITVIMTAVCDPLFQYNNMQYEIRELFILLGFIFWFIEVGEKNISS